MLRASGPATLRRVSPHPINWANLARAAGVTAGRSPEGLFSTLAGTQVAKDALEALIGEENIRAGVDLAVFGGPGELAASATAQSVLVHIQSQIATEAAYEIYRAAKGDGDFATAAIAVLVIADLCHPLALDWMDEFLEHPSTAGAAISVIIDALGSIHLESDDPRIERWLGVAEAQGADLQASNARKLITFYRSNDSS